MNYYGQQGGTFPPPPQPPQYYIPEDFVTYEEKRKIRHNYNVIGLTLLILYIAIFAVCNGSYLLYYMLGNEGGGYDEMGYPIYSFWEVFIAGCFPAIMAMIVFVGYCLCAKYNPRELFSTQNVSAGETLRYVMIVLFFQQVSFICTIFISNVLYNMGLEVQGLNYSIEHTPQTYAIDIFASIILAPIGEELIYRGVVLRCSAKVSQRFAIFFSAFIFGIMHGNPYQLVLGFLIGIPLAMITIKSGSIIPAIICHMTNNFVASISTVVSYYNEDTGYVVSLLFLPIFFIIGIIVLLSSIMKGKMKLPEYSAKHRKRTLPIMITSWSMIVVMIFYVFDIITSIGPIENPVQEEIVTETIMKFFGVR